MDLQEKIQFLASCDTSFLADALIRLGQSDRMHELTVDTSLCAPLNREDHFAGVAVPVQFGIAKPGQKTWNLFDLISSSPPGTVFVMNGCGDRCYTGDVYAKYAKLAGMGAFVVAGMIRDVKDIAKCGLPVFCKGGTTAAKGGQGAKIVSFDQPVQFYHMTVNPGDILVGDCDGLIRIPPELLDDVIFQAEDIKKLEEAYTQVFLEGTDVLRRLREIGAQKDVIRR
ncbi:MAG: hypothetical protein HFF50_01760 [Lawsonibacter sp.]|nr:hypothetical protein [Lawsonibacter sp.]